MAAQVTWTNDTVCYAFPPKISAEGFGGHISFVDDVLTASLPLLNIQIFLIYLFSNALNWILKRLRITSFASQLLTGVILGPTLLGRTDFVRNKLFPRDSHDTLEVIGIMGYITFIFLAAVKMDVAMVIRSGKKVMTIGLACMIIPMAFGLLIQRPQLSRADDRLSVNRIVGITGIQCLTTFPVVSHLLHELKLTNSEIGRLALSSSLVAGFVGTIFQLTNRTLNMPSESATTRVQSVVVALCSVAVAVFLIRPAMLWVVKRTPQGDRVKPAYVSMTIGLATAYLVLFDGQMLAFSLGPFIFGLVVPAGPPLGSSLVETLETIPQTLFFPVYVATVAMKADLTVVFEEFDNRGFFAALIYWSAIEKFVVSLLLAFPWMPLVDSVVLSLILSSKGVVDASVYAYERDSQLMGIHLYSLFIFAILVNATVIPVLVSLLYTPARRYAGYHSRNIFALKPVSELRILACIHKPHHVASMMKLLDTICRTEESAVALYVIHLLEQVGRATPVFISHQKQKRSEGSSSYSNDVFVAFDQYERNNMGCKSAQIFTSISHAKFMQEDVFTLALDKLTSLILIPFHRKWSIDGRVESDDNVLRALNHRILDMAPCSVGVLYDRGRLKSSVIDILSLDDDGGGGDTTTASESSAASRLICMIYLGGRDDREAISLAKRMANDPTVHLTILRLVSEEVEGSEAVVDDAVLGGVLRETANFLNVQCLEKVVSDGTETARVISSIADQYDLFVVGRRWNLEVWSPQTAGLANWSEFPELGVIGDLLASKDVRTRGSVLVVQQQRQLK